MIPAAIKYSLSLGILLWLFSGILIGQQETDSPISPGTDTIKELQSYYDSLFQTYNYQVNGTLYQGNFKAGKDILFLVK